MTLTEYTVIRKFDTNTIYDIQKKFPDVEYHPDVFPGAVFRLQNPKSSTLLFSTGKMVCTGAKTEKDVYRSVNNLHSLLEEKDLMLYD